MAAAKSATPVVVTALVEAGANVHTRDKTGSTPLHLAMTHGWNQEEVAALLEAGADQVAKDQNGQTPWGLIREGSPLEGTDAYCRPHDGRLP